MPKASAEFRNVSRGPVPRVLHAAACAVAALVLASCGGGGGTTYVPVAIPVAAPSPTPVDAFKPYREQVLAWEACDPSILGVSDDGDAIELDVERYGERLRCAYVRVPMDYADPSRGDLSVAMMRLSVADLGQRRGALFFNPGGPGADGLGMSLSLLGAFEGSSSSTPLGRLQLQLLAQYDMVGFSPRGTGASTRLNCGTNEVEREVDPTPEGRTAKNVENMLYNLRKESEACKRNPIAPYINSDATARDMDLMRGLLGDDKLNYLGYSYGTWLGAWYAARFPERVGRMVLDSSMNFAADTDAAEIITAPAVQRVLDEVWASYAARHPDAFNLGQTPEAVRAVVPAIPPLLRGSITHTLKDGMYSAAATGESLLTINAARGLAQVLATHPGADKDTILEALEAHVFVPGSAQTARDQYAREKAVFLYEAQLEKAEDQGVSSISLNASSAVYRAVLCNDTAGNTDVDYWIGLGNSHSRNYPLYGSLITGTHCAYWGGPSVTRAPVSALAGLDILMVQSEYDSATPAEGAMDAFGALPIGHMVYVPGELSHGLYPYRDQCVDTAVTRYLLGDSPVERQTVCAAHPLRLDAESRARRASMASMASMASAYKDPEAAAAQIERFKTGIWRAARARGLQ